MICEAILNRRSGAGVRLNPEFPLTWSDIVDKALEKDRNLRYQHAADMRTDLERLKRDSSTGRFAVPTVLPEESSSSGRTSSAVTPPEKQRSRLGIYAALLALLLIAAAIGAYLVSHRSQPKAPVSTQWEQLTFFTDSVVYPLCLPTDACWHSSAATTPSSARGRFM